MSNTKTNKGLNDKESELLKAYRSPEISEYGALSEVIEGGSAAGDLDSGDAS